MAAVAHPVRAGPGQKTEGAEDRPRVSHCSHPAREPPPVLRPALRKCCYEELAELPGPWVSKNLGEKLVLVLSETKKVAETLNKLYIHTAQTYCWV